MFIGVVSGVSGPAPQEPEILLLRPLPPGFLLTSPVIYSYLQLSTFQEKLPPLLAVVLVLSPGFSPLHPLKSHLTHINPHNPTYVFLLNSR